MQINVGRKRKKQFLKFIKKDQGLFISCLISFFLDIRHQEIHNGDNKKKKEYNEKLRKYTMRKIFKKRQKEAR